ncbi:hypothetical protein [Xanthomonas citri]|uniref:hypothetical protein n=1 Tax=Xanthomonas citri TaxID=346 RepID=UPI002AB06823|nr:hypothetical protein [Xanthomonas citri]
MTESLFLQACMPSNIDSAGMCTASVWIEKPEPVLPPLTLAEGTQVALAIASCWALGAVFRQYARASKERF